MKPYYQDSLVKIYHGDALDVLPHIPDASCSAVVSDPPYASGGRNQAAARNIISKSDTRDADEWFLSDNMGSDTYVRWMRVVGRECMRASRPGRRG